MSSILTPSDVQAACELLAEQSKNFYCSLYTPSHALVNINYYLQQEGFKYPIGNLRRGCSASMLNLPAKFRSPHERCVALLKEMGLIVAAQLRTVVKGAKGPWARGYNSVPTELGVAVCEKLLADGMRPTANITTSAVPTPAGPAVKNAKRHKLPDSPLSLPALPGKSLEDFRQWFEAGLRHIAALESGAVPLPASADIVAAAAPPIPTVKSVNSAELLTALIAGVVETVVRVCDTCTAVGGDSQPLTEIDVRDLYCTLTEANRVIDGFKSHLSDCLSAGCTTVNVSDLQEYREAFMRMIDRIRLTADGTIRGPVLIMSDTKPGPGIGRFHIRTLSRPVWRKSATPAARD